jgi:hypothetical protein
MEKMAWGEDQQEVVDLLASISLLLDASSQHIQTQTPDSTEISSPPSKSTQAILHIPRPPTIKINSQDFVPGTFSSMDKSDAYTKFLHSLDTKRELLRTFRKLNVLKTTLEGVDEIEEEYRNTIPFLLSQFEDLVSEATWASRCVEVLDAKLVASQNTASIATRDLLRTRLKMKAQETVIQNLRDELEKADKNVVRSFKKVAHLKHRAKGARASPADAAGTSSSTFGSSPRRTTPRQIQDF